MAIFFIIAFPINFGISAAPPPAPRISAPWQGKIVPFLGLLLLLLLLLLSSLLLSLSLLLLSVKLPIDIPESDFSRFCD